MEKIDLRNIQELFYTSKTNKELCELIELLGPDFDLSKFPDSYYQVYKKLGIELVFNKQHYFERIIIHQKSKECLKFHFPFGLNLDLKRSDVERILGIPERSGGGSKRMNCWVGYPEKGIFIDYQTKNQNNNTATIAYISLKPVENELSRIRFITKTEIHIFFQARSTIYTSGVIADLLGLPADRVDENDHNLFEIFLTKNPHLTMKTQLTDAFIFIDGISDRLSKVSDEVDFRLKINITSFRSNSIRFKLSREFLYKLRDLGIEVEYEFMT